MADFAPHCSSTEIEELCPSVLASGRRPLVPVDFAPRSPGHFPCDVSTVMNTLERPKLIQIFRELASEIAEKDFSHIQEDMAIKDLGIDSLAMLELVGSMERMLRVRVPDDQLVGLETVRQLLELVEGRIVQPQVREMSTP